MGKATRLVNCVPHVGLAAALRHCSAAPVVHFRSLGVAGAWIANLGIFAVYRPYISVAAPIVILIGWMIAIRREAQHDP